MAHDDKNKGGNQPPQNPPQQPPSKVEAELGPVEKQFAALKAEAKAQAEAKIRPPSEGKKRFRALKTVIVQGIAYEAGAVFDAVEAKVSNQFKRGDIEAAK